jgi:hypothetical protein
MDDTYKQCDIISISFSGVKISSGFSFFRLIECTESILEQ